MKDRIKIFTNYLFLTIPIVFVIILMGIFIIIGNTSVALSFLPLLIVLIGWLEYAIENDEVWTILEQATDYLEHFSNKYEKLVNDYNDLVDNYNKLNPTNLVERIEE